MPKGGCPMVLPLEIPLSDRSVEANVKIMKCKAKDPVLSFCNSCGEWLHEDEKLHQYQ